jgi:hypothetical protein
MSESIKVVHPWDTPQALGRVNMTTTSVDDHLVSVQLYIDVDWEEMIDKYEGGA